jgi:putative FmdB family regulatory protein
MPLYSHRCLNPKCRVEFDQFRPLREWNKPVACTSCGGLTELFLRSGPAGHVWDSEKEYENFEENPIKFRTKGDMRKYCRERKLGTGALL